MSKYLSLMTAVVVCLAAASAQADNGISSGMLKAMGLSSLSVMSDSDALSIRGMGYNGGSRGNYGKKKVERPSASAEGRSWAKVELEGENSSGEAGTRNSYKANGRYEASGDNFSEATLSKTTSEVVDYSDSTTSSVTHVYSIHVEAGGFSSAKAF